jgi:hypothetical protein
MGGHAKTIASTGQDSIPGLLCFRSRFPQRKFTITARRDEGKLSVSVDMLSTITEQSLRFVFPVHMESPLPIIRSQVYFMHYRTRPA